MDDFDPISVLQTRLIEFLVHGEVSVLSAVVALSRHLSGRFKQVLLAGLYVFIRENLLGDGSKGTTIWDPPEVFYPVRTKVHCVFDDGTSSIRGRDEETSVNFLFIPVKSRCLVVCPQMCLVKHFCDACLFSFYKYATLILRWDLWHTSGTVGRKAADGNRRNAYSVRKTLSTSTGRRQGSSVPL